MPIEKTIQKFYSHIKNYEEGNPNTRYKSWEWCHNYFVEHHNDEHPDIDLMALHLGFYLASWGMYRASSFLIECDYKVHKKAVEIILEEQYETLWDYIPDENNIEKTAELLFRREEGLYYRISESYERCAGRDLTDTLITKILLGTFGCVPAFDKFLKSGIAAYESKKIGGYRLTQVIAGHNGETFKALATLAYQNKEEFVVVGVPSYPPMKCVDMYFWQIGIEKAETVRQ